MFSIFGGTEARRLPGRFQFPRLSRRQIILAVMVLMAVGAAYGVSQLISRVTSGDTAPAVSQPVVSQPAAQPVQQAPGVVAPTATLLTLRWEEYDLEKNPIVYDRWGKDKRGVYSADENGGGIPMNEFIGTGTARDAIVYIRDVRMITGASKENSLEFSLDGERWFRATNLPEQALNAQIRGAVWDGKDILILANWQYEPWKYKVYAARVTPQDTKRVSQ